MGKSIIMASGGASSTANTTEYGCVVGTTVLETSETTVRIPFREPGVVSNFAVIVISNGINGSSTIRLRKNNANTNCLVTIPANSNGYYEDATNTVSVAAGDFLSTMFTPGASTGTLNTVQISFVFTPTDTTKTYTKYGNTSAIANGVSENNYHVISGIVQTTYQNPTAMDQAYVTPKAAGTFKHFSLYSSTGTGRAVRMDMPKNGTDPAANTCLIGSASTGLSENTSTTVSVNGSSDTVNLLIGYGGGSGSRTVNNCSVAFETLTNHFLFVNGRAEGNPFNANETKYLSIGGRLISNSSETNCRMKARIPLKLSQLAVRYISNTVNGNIVITLRKNGADTGITVTIPNGSSSGLVEDTTHEEIISETDEINLEYDAAGSTGTINLTSVTTLAEYYPVIPPIDAVSDWKDILKQRPQQLITNSI